MPAEHGAWGILLVPLVSTALVAGGPRLPFLLLTGCAVGLLVLRGSWEPAARKRNLFSRELVLLAGVTAAAAVILLFLYHRRQLLIIGGAGAILWTLQHQLAKRPPECSTEKRSLAAELLGALLLTLSAPAAWIAQRGALSAEGVQIWLLNFLFFAGGVLYVKYRVRGVLAHRSFRSLRERAEFAWPVFAYHLLLALFLLAWIAANSLSAWVLAAFAPALLRAGGLLFQLGTKFPIKRLGWSEVGQALLFAVLLLMALR